MATDYIVRLKCPYGDREQLLILENRPETLRQILETRWDFECPAHGVQQELPLEGSQKRLWASPQRKDAKPADQIPEQAKPQARSSKRISLHVPVEVFGWSRGKYSFHEEATTLLVNASGGLMPLNAGVALGDAVFVVNKQTHRELECRVAYLGKDARGTSQVGLAFKTQAPHFWRLDRREYRIAKRIRVKVLGMDRLGNRFVQNVVAVDISQHGARVENIGYLTRPGETVYVKRLWRSARFRVVWIGEFGTAQDGQAGLIALEPNKNIWGVALR